MQEPGPMYAQLTHRPSSGKIPVKPICNLNVSQSKKSESRDWEGQWLQPFPPGGGKQLSGLTAEVYLPRTSHHLPAAGHRQGFPFSD